MAASRGTVVFLRHPPRAPVDADLRELAASLPDGVRVEPSSVAGPPDSEAIPAGHDVVLVEAGVTLGLGWLERLREAADDLTVATASAQRFPAGRASAPPGTAPMRWTAPWPRIPAPVAGCVLARASALHLAGPLDDGFAARCANLALVHVLVPDVPALADDEPVRSPEADGREEPPADGPRRARLWLGAALDGVDVTIDGRSLTGVAGGTQVHTLELIRALHRTGAVRLRVAVPIDPHPSVTEALAALRGVEVLDGSRVDAHTARTSVVHRPHQVTGPQDMLLLRRLGRRIVISHQDLIGYHNPGYHAEEQLWRSYRNLTAASLQAADLVTAISAHARSDLLAEDLVPDNRVIVVALGADHLSAVPGPATAPPAIGSLDGRPFLLVLGADLRHKNRPFAIRLLLELRDRHGWDGQLVFAGPHVDPGSSAPEEAQMLARPEVGQHVSDLGVVDEATKSWLLKHAAAVAYPSTHEGFGLIPFEAAAHETPSLYAHGFSLAELLPAASALIVPWDAAATAARVAPVLRDPGRAAQQVGVVRAAARELTWDRTAAALVGAYERALRSPPRDATATALRVLEAEARALEFEDRLRLLYEDVGGLGVFLVGKRAGLLPEDAQRALAGLLQRRATRRVLLGGLVAGRRARRLAGAPARAVRRS